MKTYWQPVFSALSLVLLLSGCASMGKSIKCFISGSSCEEQAAKPQSGPTKYSDNENMHVNSDRQYKRMNRQRFEDEAELKEDAGSLWVMEGQGAYLFSQNQMRMVGDLLNVKIDGAPKTQLQTKVHVISKLLERLETPNRGLASAQSAATPAAAGGAAAATPGAPGAPAAANPPAADANAPVAAEAAAAAPGAAAKGETPFAVQVVPTRIVEQLKDGSYRVRGMQPFMIGKREYKVIVTGIVRAEDFDDAGLDAARLLDSQFDIVSSRKGASL